MSLFANRPSRVLLLVLGLTSRAWSQAPAPAPEAPPTPPAPVIVAELKPLKDDYEAKRGTLMQPFNDLATGYRTALEHFKDTANRVGNLEATLAATDAIKDLEAGNPDKTSKASEVEIYRRAYIQQRNLKSKEMVGQLAQATIGYLEQLRPLRLKLVQEHRDEDAKAVAKEEGDARRSLQTLTSDSPIITPVPRTRLTETPSPNPAPSSPAVPPLAPAPKL